MEMICKGISESECFRMAIDEYEGQLMDKQAISQALHRPLWQALKVFKWIYGYTCGHTMQHNKVLCKKWRKIELSVMEHYGILDLKKYRNQQINPELLGDMNLYAIDLVMKDALE